jgi:biotin transporter BioY
MINTNTRKSLVTLFSVSCVSLSVVAITVGFAFLNWLPEWSWTKKFLSTLVGLVFLYAAGVMGVLASTAHREAAPDQAAAGDEGSKILGYAVLIALLAGVISSAAAIVIVYKFLVSAMA